MTKIINDQVEVKDEDQNEEEEDFTLHWGSTTAMLSLECPILQVQEGW